MAINLIDVGATANDGSGDPIRSAFQTVNDNFDYINGGLYAGSQASTISAVSVSAGYVISNTYIVANTSITGGSVTANTVTSNGNLFVSKDGGYIIGNLTVIGNLSVSGSQAASQSQQSGSPILGLHYSATPLSINDGKDIGLEWQYFTGGAEKKAFFGWQNSSGSLIYQDDITDTANVITAGYFGNVQIGSLLISNTTAATSNTSGALKVTGGISTQGNLYVAGNIAATYINVVGNLTFPSGTQNNSFGSMRFGGSDTIYINGSPVQTAAQSFNGGTVGLATLFNDATPSTSSTTGAMVVTGGAGIGGNLYVAGNIILPTSNAATIRGNISGNIFTAAQPFITSLGSLTSLNMVGQINAQSIVPTNNNTYSLGSSNSTRWLKIWAFDTDVSGSLNAATINGSGVLTLNGGTKSTATSNGDLVVSGGVGVGGNIFVGGSVGTAITITGNIVPSANMSGNVGSKTSWFQTFYGVSTQAQYADLAENYLADDRYQPGTVVVFGGSKEITVTADFADHRVAGVISTNPAYLMNATAEGLPVALRGRVPVRVSGPVNKGDLLVTSTTPGYATSVGSDTGFGVRIFAKSLETNPANGTKIIEAVII